MEKIEYSNNSEHLKHLWEKGYEFNLGDYVSRGWEIFRGNPVNFVLYALVYFLIVGSLEALDDGFGGLLQVLLGAPLSAGFLIVADKVARGEDTEFGDFFKGFNHFVQLVVGNLTIMVLFAIGLLFLVIPGIYLIVAYMLWMPLVLFEQLNFWPALETSRKIVTRNWWNFLLLGIVFFGIAILGILALGIGILAAFPVIYCVVYAVYEDLISNNSTLADQIG